MTQYGYELLQPPPWLPDNTCPVDLKAQRLVSAYHLVSDYSWSVAGGAGPGSIPADAAGRVYWRLRHMLSGSPRVNCAGQALKHLNAFWGEAAGAMTDVDPTTDAAGTLELNRRANIVVPCAMPHFIGGEIFAFPTTGEDGAGTLEVDLVRPARLVTGPDPVAVITMPTPPSGFQLREIPIFGADPNPKRYGAMLILDDRKVISAAGQETIQLKMVKLGMKNVFLRAVLVEAFDNGLAGENHLADDAVIADVKLDVAGQIRCNTTPWNVQRDRNAYFYGLPARRSGAVLIDSCENKSPDMWHPGSNSAPELTLSYNAPAGEAFVRITAIIAALPAS